MVFAHELGHNANHHVADKIQNANTGALVGLLLGIAIGANPADAMDLGANIGATSYSIDYENEADYLSIIDHINSIPTDNVIANIKFLLSII